MIDALIEFVRNQLNSELGSAGLFVTVLGSLIALMRNVPGQLWAWVKRRVVTQVDITDHDVAYQWVEKWLSEHAYTRGARLLTASTRTRAVDESSINETVVANEPVGEENKQIDVLFTPAPGTHLIKHKGSWLILQRDRRSIDHNGSTAYRENITFYTFSRKLVQDIIYEARDLAMPPGDNSVGVYRPHGWSWSLTQQRQPRALSTVVLASGVAEDLDKDLKKFFSSSSWYTEMGIPYQRGYLLAGPPGGGKTSLVTAIASRYGRGIYALTLGSMTDNSLSALMALVPRHGIVLLEDVDCDFVDRSSNNDYLSYNGFLNAIDGLSAAPGRVLFMTTNHPEKLDSALKRPGRADRTIDLEYATTDQAQRMFTRFFPDEPTAAAQFARSVGQFKDVSMAAIQEHLVMTRGDLEEATQFIHVVPTPTNGRAPQEHLTT